MTGRGNKEGAAGTEGWGSWSDPGQCQGTVVLTATAAGMETPMAVAGSADVKNRSGNHFSFLPALNPNFPAAAADPSWADPSFGEPSELQ